MLNQKVKILSALALCAAIAGCGSGSGTPTGLSFLPGGDMSFANGSAQKGPFIAGSTVTLNVLSRSTTIRELNPQSTSTSNATRSYNLPVLSQSGKTFTLETDNKGEFLTSSLAFSPNESVLQVSVEGYYFDEITGLRSSDQIALRGIIDISSTNVNVNILTDLSRARVLKLARDTCPVPAIAAAPTAVPCMDSSKLSKVIEQAEREVLQAFNVSIDLLGSPQKRFADMNFKKIANSGFMSPTKPEDQLLLAISALVMQIGKEGSGITEFVNAFESDIEDNGVLDGADLKQQIATASSTVNFSRVAQNMNSFYKTNKYAAVDLQKWVDPSGGVVGVIAGQTDFYNVTTSSFNRPYTSATQSFKATGANGSCLQLISSNASSSLSVNGTSLFTTPNTTTTSSAVYVPKNASVTFSVTSTPTSLSGQARVVSSDAIGLNSCPAVVQTATGSMGVYHFAATPPGLNNFGNKFIADFAKCFNLTPTNRVRASDLRNPDIPEATDVNELCKPLAGSPTTNYLHNGYNAGQQLFWLLSDGSMSKNARITDMDVTDYFVGRNGQQTAKILFQYVDRFNRKGTLTVFATQDGNYLSSSSSGWYNTGNRQPVDINLMVGVRRYTSLPLQLTSARPITDVKIKYRSAFLPIIRGNGPGVTLQNGSKLTAVRITGPGLPTAGLVYIPPLQKGQTDFDFSNMEGTLPDGRPVAQLKRCGWQPTPDNGVWPAVPATCTLNWVAASNWTAPNSAVDPTFGQLAYPVPVLNSTYSDRIVLPNNPTALMTRGTEYQFSLFYNNSSTPEYVYTKRLNTSVPTFAEAHASPWLNLESVGNVNLLSLKGSNAFEGLRPQPNQTTLDISWSGHKMNSLEVTNINTNLQMPHYPRASPSDSVARGLTYGTLAPQLDQDGISREMQWTGSTNPDGTPNMTQSPLNLLRNISLSLRTWDGSWKSQDFFIETFAR
jgi:hypothetical protein